MKLLTGDLIRLVETPKERAADALAALGGVEGVASSLGVALESGLDSTNAADLGQREATYGKNYIEPEKPSTILELMWQAFQDLTIIILSVAGVFSLVLGLVAPHHSSVPKNGTVSSGDDDEPNTAWIEGVSILFAVLIVTLVTAINDYQKEKQFRALNAVKEDEKIKVIRNGVPAEVSKFNLLVGDIVRVDLGDILPADGLVFDENDLKLDESAMTGESLLLRKSPTEAPFLLSGTKVMEGVGKMLVLCVGESSQAGIISKLIMGKSTSSGAKPPSPSGPPTEKTPLIGEKSTPSEPAQHDEDVVVSPLQGKLDQLTMLIGKLGLATALIVFLALVVRFSIETFAGPDGKPWSNDYLSDYLGFFIIGITVLVVAIPEGLPLAVTIALAFSVKKMLLDNNLVRHLDACETMGSATTICSDKTGTLTTNRMTVVESYVGGSEFSSAKKLQSAMATETASILSDGICLNSTAEILPPLKEGGKPEHTGNKTECALLQFAADMGVAYADVRKGGEIGHMITFSSAKKRMSVVVRVSATTCRVFTKGASEIVLELWHCGILSPNDGSLVMEGTEFRRRVLDSNGNIIQSEFDKIWPMLRVLARSSPKDKYTLVSGLIASNVYPHGPQVVAVTGDGTNDAPALKKADVGFAMGICGTAVAKDASDIILMDDNFKSIVNAVKWGRNVYDSISKFLQFQLTVNVVAISMAVLGAVFIEESPLSAIQMLWVNLIMDTFASLALATDSPTEALLERKPYPRTKPLISKKMTKHIVGQSVFQLVVLLTMTFYGDVLLDVPSGHKTGPSIHYTMVFNTFVFLQLFNEVNARRIHDELNVFEGFFSNKLYIGISVLQAALQVIIVQFGGLPFKCKPLSSTQWLICLGIGAASLPIGLVLRLIETKDMPKGMGLLRDAEPSEGSAERGKELWSRGVMRVRTQIRVVKAFKRSMGGRQLALNN
ncbi:calcium-translocating P-type ATPase [Saprolegnia parasitica CBS 223.65]|uniref:P-type Ca(2+) transporter n=1 Tax=Saprolegnia parasitica (strain CBS 223.65) TaxID=695850 RepID=A0A067D4S2_SAPPC|nr:calcium-translocating P-type ATPase [Saprolegnia parasitica CBS 223.65]KDO33671.1 calcium-translocating P-type ATPase [Saprolegnia parasitica CBS 223.65]|eukprot:XP_012195699.1 calcium-translocating P-type ATPase [Saprolegnia parasitica CBS 223.65]